MNKILIEARNLKKYFTLKKKLFSAPQYIKAVDGINLAVREGEVLGLVGESGCGKSTLGRILLRLSSPDAGEIFYKGQDILKVSARRMRLFRKELQIIFQDPFGSLNPRFKIKALVGEGLKVFYARESKDFINKKIDEVLELVGLSPDIKDRYPHEFSGGQRQRISIARAIILNPRFVVCDEPVSSLDVSIQAQIINLLRNLKEKLNLAYLFIAHDLSVVNYISDNIAVIYLGKIVEYGTAQKICHSPQHPYTQDLLAALPKINTGKIKQEESAREVLPAYSVYGCNFYSRCKFAKDICREEEPGLKDNGNNHFCACHLR